MAGPKAGLQLRAEDAEDLAVIAACLQDALLPLSEMAFLPEDRRFVAVLDRFTWEDRPDDAPPTYQVQSALRFEGVQAARVTGIDQSARGQVLELLTLAGEAGAMVLVFAGNGAVRLEGDKIVCFLQDLAAPRPVGTGPVHHLGADEEEAR